jgi:hypothetical protein
MRELDLEDKDRVQGGAIDRNRSPRVRSLINFAWVKHLIHVVIIPSRVHMLIIISGGSSCVDLYHLVDG